MNKSHKVLLFPGTLQNLNGYSGYNGVSIWERENLTKVPEEIEFLIGHSLGASYVLNLNSEKNLILINPLVKRRGKAQLFFRWIKFNIFEGIPFRNRVSVKYWWFSLRQLFDLLKIDVLEKIKKIPKERLTIIIGEKDVFYCDKENQKILRENGFDVINVDAKHNWNENVAEVVKKII